MAFRISPYSARAICSQLFCLALTLLIAALPLAGLKLERAPILTPSGEEPVPLDTSLQLPSGSSFHLPSLETSGRLVLGPLPSLVLALVFRGDSRLHVTSSETKQSLPTFRRIRLREAVRSTSCPVLAACVTRDRDTQFNANGGLLT
jgi:hypothetical protein